MGGVRQTLESLEEWLAFLGCPQTVGNRPFPIAPIRNILQLLVERAVLQVLGAHDACSSARIDEIIEFDLARAAVFARPGGRNWAARVHVCKLRIHNGFLDLRWFEFKRVDLDAVEDLCTRLSSVSEHQVV